MRTRVTLMSLIAFAAVAALRSTPADAGCGCNKPPPALSAVRPAFASPTDVVTLFSTQFKEGWRYDVKFSNASSSSPSATVRVTAVKKRDLADGVLKVMLEVRAPSVAIGPTRIRVYKAGDDDKLLEIASSNFTMMQAPLALQQGDGETIAKCYQAAVTANNTVLLPLDISAIAEHMIFQGLGDNYPLLFDADDIAIYNTQGFLMQLLGPNEAGIYAIDDFGAPDSLALTYDRHEFLTYRAAHAHTGGLGLNPSDPRWHTDGTYHVDHDRLVVAIRGTVENQGPPAAGKTPRFDLRIATAIAEPGSATPVVSRTIQWSTACSSSGNSGSGGSDDDEEDDD